MFQEDPFIILKNYRNKHDGKPKSKKPTTPLTI